MYHRGKQEGVTQYERIETDMCVCVKGWGVWVVGLDPGSDPF